MLTPQRMNAIEARHLLVRTGFTPTQAEVDKLVGQSAQSAVASIVAAALSSKPKYPAPDFVNLPPPIPLGLLKTDDERQAQRQQQLREGLEIKAWWMREMLETNTPLTERMTLFWHNHFATSMQKVGRSQAMWSQHLQLRGQAVGSFRTLLHAIAKDPAMLVYLDGNNNRKEAPNENFAREVMELFTLGEATQGGGYTEQDIKEVARSFTGWSVERDDFSFKFRKPQHDTASKTVLNRTGNFDGDEVLDILIEQPATARFIVGKLWREFVSPTPDQTRVDQIAQQFGRSNFSIQVALTELLMSDAFWDDKNRGSLIKSPVDLVVGTVRQFGFSYNDVLPFVLKVDQLGQNLLMPPNVKGWPGYTDWINATTLLERKRFSEQLFRTVEPRADGKMQDPLRPNELRRAELRTDMMKNDMRSEMMQGASAQTQRSLRALGREGILRVAQSMATIRFDSDKFLETYGGHTDREPKQEVKDALADVLFASSATQTIANGTVGIAYLRAQTLDPAYQLK
jgi:uncharacterized protein (DUF1800 family)